MFIRFPARSRNSSLPLIFGIFLSSPVWAQGAAPVSQFQLANGMTVIVKTDRRAPTAAHMLWVRVGAMDEVDGTSGVAHVLEHMLFKGTPDMKPGDFSRRVAALGGRDNAFTSRDATGYHQQIPAAKLEEANALGGTESRPKRSSISSSSKSLICTRP